MLLVLLLIALAVAVVLLMARNSPTMWLLPNIAIITFLVAYIFPMHFAQVSNQLRFSIVICFSAIIITSLVARRIKIRFRKFCPGVGRGKLLPFLGVFFLCDRSWLGVYEHLYCRPC